MKKNYFILLLTILFAGITSAQESQKNFINYQGVARNSENALMEQKKLEIGIALKFGSANATAVYAENHSVTTDANGVFSLLIGNGSSVNGDYNALPWGSAGTFVTVLINGNEIGTTEMMAVPYAITSGDGDNQSADEVHYTNTTSGLAATTTQAAIDELATGGILDADADPNNEIQTISFDGATNELSLTDGGTVTLPSGGTDADPDPTNELQLLSFDEGTNELSLSDGNSVTIPSGGTDADPDPTNEIQDISLAGTELTISDGSTIDLAPIVPPGGSDDQNAGEVLYDNTASGLVATTAQDAIDELFSSGTADADNDPENEIDVTRNHGLLVGDDGIIDGLVGTADGQVAKWDADLGNWVAGADETGAGGTGSPTGLEALNEGSGQGWRLIGRDPDRVGPIGSSAVDFSFSLEDSETRGATGPHSTTFGYHTTADGEAATAMGQYTHALAEGATAMGSSTRASAPASFAMGHGSRAEGIVSTAMGSNTKANADYAFAIGRYNIGGGERGVLDPNDPLFEIGNGIADDARSNALTVLKNGNVGVGAAVPTAKFEVDGDIRSSDLAGSGQRNVMADADGNLVIGTSGGSSLWSRADDDINFTGGNVGVGVFVPSGRTEIAANSTTAFPQLVLNEDQDDYARLAFKNTVHIGAQWHIAGTARNGAIGAANSRLNFWFKNDVGATDHMTILGNGNVGVGTTSPTSKLDVVGDIKTSGEVHGPATGSANMIPIAYGNIHVSRGVDSGSGNFTLNRLGTGEYEITISDDDFNSNLTVLTTMKGPSPGFITLSTHAVLPKFYVYTFDRTGNPKEVSFSFAAFSE